MRATAVTVLLLFCLDICAQRPCASSQYNEEQRLKIPSISNTQLTVENFVQQQALQTLTHLEGESTSIIKIPVVVHVLYNNDAQNLSIAQIKSGIEALNRDFRKKNDDSINIPVRFKALAADVEIEFFLATADPKGRATGGIIRKATSIYEWRMDDKIKKMVHGGSDAWDPKSYLNIWIGPMRNLLGYASSPGGAVETDGIVINTTSFGTLNSPAPYHLGRTTVHELGHWLGLKHIWGDTYCGDDLVYDTPPQGNFTAGCPTNFRSSCNNGATGDMYMNYMDFTYDACMNLFTQGQKQRMRSLFNSGGTRASLLASKGLEKPWREETPLEEVITTSPSALKLFPNPAASFVVLDLSYDASWIGKELSILNANGTVLRKEIIASKTQRLSLLDLKPGLYFIQAQNGSQKLNQKLIKL